VIELRHRAAGLPRRWLVAGAVMVIAAALAVVLTLRLTGGAACAAVPAGMPAAVPAVPAAVPVAVPVGSSVHSGQATFYTSRSGSGNCSFPSAPPGDLYVALSPGEYAAAGACGGYLDVTGPHGTVRVKVTDQCPGCATGHLDLSRTAFARIADPSAGQVPVTYRAVVNPPLPAPLSFRIKDGASQWWFALLVDSHGNPLRSVQARSGSGSWRTLDHADYNYWLADDGLGGGPFSVRVTDVYGNQATASGIRMAPNQAQPSQVWMYGHAPAAGARTTATAGATRGPVGSASPSTSPGPTGSPVASPIVSGTGAAAAGTVIAAAGPDPARPTACAHVSRSPGPPG
jgi:expansin (peptidoglycan-binding protein)